jgi:HlyD family secretion protein
MLRILKKFWWLIILIVVAIIVIFVFTKGAGPEYEYTTEQVVRGDLVQTVDATGKVQSAEEVSLSFQTTGVVRDIFAVVGQDVLKDDPIIGLDDRELKFKLSQAEASLSQAQADLNRQLAGASTQDINVSQITVDKALLDYQNAIAELETLKIKLDKDVLTYDGNLDKAKKAYEDAKTDLDNINSTQGQYLVNYKEDLIVTMNDSLADLTVAIAEVDEVKSDSNFGSYMGILDGQSRNDQEVSYLRCSSAYAIAKASFVGLDSLDSDTVFDAVYEDVNDALSECFEELKNMYVVLDNSVNAASLTTSDISTYKTNITNQQTYIIADINSLKTDYQTLANGRITKQTQSDSYQSSLNAAENSYSVSQANYNLAIASQNSQIQSQENKIKIYKSSWELSVSQLNLKAAKPRYVDIAPNQARVAQMQAAYELAQKQFEDAVIKAPIDGTVTAIEYEIGEQVTATSAKPHVVKMENLDGFEIEVDISESDIAKIQQDDKVEITLDAFGDDKAFEGIVNVIDPGETVIQEVIYYTVKIVFDPGTEDEVKPGMTANTLIFTDERADALFVPRRAVIENNGSGKVVRILDGKTHKEIPVQTGLRADNGLVEIISGLTEGQEIVTYMKEAK